MSISQEMLQDIILEVMEQMKHESAEVSVPTEALEPLIFVELGVAKKGTGKGEVVIGVPPAFGNTMTKTIIGIPHSDVLREVMAGIEEEGLKSRLVRVNKTADVAFISHEAAKLSGSGVGIGILARGTSVIHQQDLPPLQNLELFSQSPLVDLETFRNMGRNAAKYAKGDTPNPVPVRNDPMARPRYQGLAALLHNKEVELVVADMPSTELKY